jgi:hypothetical protein
MKSAKKSTPNSEYDFCETIEGLKVEMKRALLSKRSETFLTTEDNIAKIKKENIINVSDPEEDEIPKEEYPAAPVCDEDEEAAAFAEKLKTWEEGKAKWEEEQANKPPLKKVTAWAPVYHVTEARVDGMLLKVFHTVRGPMMGLVVSETSNEITLYSPAYVDPNIRKGQVHYLPVAFAGYSITLHKPCFGESNPDEALVYGYPRFLKANQNGDYIMRQQGAYHHVEADFAEYVKPVVQDVGMRELLRGILVTSDTRQPQEIAQAKAMEEMIESAKKQAAAAEAAKEDAASQEETNP